MIFITITILLCDYILVMIMVVIVSKITELRYAEMMERRLFPMSSNQPLKNQWVVYMTLAFGVMIDIDWGR